MRVLGEPAYILHARPWRETSQLLDIFSRHHGRLTLIARGSRGGKSRTGGLLQPFRPLLMNWSGRGEMPTLQAADAAETPAPALRGNELVAALYINELLVHLLHRHDVHEELFGLYHEVLGKLPGADELELCLREFELRLLENIGFGLNLEFDADSGEPVDATRRYIYHVEHGPVATSAVESNEHPVVSGSSLLALRRGGASSETGRAEAKKLMRYVLQHYLGSRKLRSRELFRRTTK